LIYAFFGVSISEYRPFSDDEIAYWHQALTFSQVGFHGGYYTLDERTNPSGLTPFGPHGPGFGVLLGLVGTVFGWSRSSVVVVNLIAIAAAAGVWASLTRVSLARVFLAGVTLLTFWHMVFWAPTGMQESLHHAGAIVLAACFASVLGPEPRRWVTVFGWVVLGVLSFIRPSWIIVMPLWAAVTTLNTGWRTVAAAIGGSLLAGALILFAYSSTVAPYGTGFVFLRAASLSLPLEALVGNVQANLQRVARSDQYHPIELLFRHQYVAFLLVACAATVWAVRRRSVAPHVAIAAIALTTGITAMLLLYEFASFAEHRVLSAFLLFAAMLCVAAPGRLGPLLVAGLVLSNVLSVHMALTEFEAVWRDRFRWAGQDLSDLTQAIDGKVVYREGVSRWCNTLLTVQYPRSLIAIPAGIGLSVVRKAELLHFPLRSHYILIDDQLRAASPEPLHLDAIATLPYGTFYVNRDSGCD
jgi:hypothetical protein